MVESPSTRALGVLAPDRLGVLVGFLRAEGYAVHAPILDHGALVIREIDSADRLPRGVVDEAGPGTQRVRIAGDRLFDYTVPADSWKRLLFPPRLRLWSARSTDGEIRTSVDAEPARPLALLGVRGCDLRAMQVQDRVFLGGAQADEHYRARREGAFIVAVNCARATPGCFCASMGTGPGAGPGHDLALTELRDGRLVVEAGSEHGARVLASLGADAATGGDVAEAMEIVAATEASIERTMPAGIAATLRAAPESPRWQAIADRCLACGSCTMVCPTCFCSAVEHTTDLAGQAHHDRRWDSCFNADHSYIHGGSIRRSTAARHRQWMTHKLATWHEQFGTSGCTGCARCIVWCPVGIDITAEAHGFVADATGGRT